VRQAVILAGGLGTRLRGVVPDLPKPMAPVNGRPFLEHLLAYWIGQGITRFVLSVGYRREAIMSHFGSEYGGAALAYAVEEVPLGTGGGLLLALEHVNGVDPFLLLNGDTYFEVKLAALERLHAEGRADCTIALFRAAESGRYMAVDIANDGRIVALNAGTAKAGQLANGGAYLVQRPALRALGWDAGKSVSLESELLPLLHGSGGRLFGCECGGRFIDIGVPGDYARVPGVLGA